MQRSVIGIVSDGQLQQAYSYTPYGKTDYTKNTNMPSTIQYLSRQYDQETGDYYLINRYYNADRGTFNTPDIPGNTNYSIPYSFNPYQYAFNNPVSYTDPDGDYPYQVRKGDSLWKIAKETGVDLSILEQANLSRVGENSLIMEGQSLWIPEVHNPGDMSQTTMREGNREVLVTEWIDAIGIYYYKSLTRTKSGPLRMASNQIGFGDQAMNWLTLARDDFFEGNYGAYFSSVKAGASAYDEMKTLTKLKPLLEDDANLVIKYAKSSPRLLKIGGEQGSKIRELLGIKKLYNLKNMKLFEKLKLQKALGFVEEAKIPGKLRYLRKAAFKLRFLNSWAVGALVSPIANAVKYKAEGKDIMSTDYFVETGMDILKGAVVTGAVVLATAALAAVGVSAVPAAIIASVGGIFLAVKLDIEDNKRGVTSKAQEIFREGIKWWKKKLQPEPKPPIVPLLSPCPAGWHPRHNVENP